MSSKGASIFVFVTSATSHQGVGKLGIDVTAFPFLYARPRRQPSASQPPQASPEVPSTEAGPGTCVGLELPTRRARAPSPFDFCLGRPASCCLTLAQLAVLSKRVLPLWSEKDFVCSTCPIHP